MKVTPDWSSLHKLGEQEEPRRDYVQRTRPPRDRLAGVYFAATEHDEDQPVHLIVHDTSVCVTRCAEEYGNPCTRFCPASVYEIVEDAASEHGKRLQINAANCVHCKTCDIKDPYEIITWVRSEEHTSELQSLMRISYAVFCLKKKTNNTQQPLPNTTYS